jgi:hypothetical protein
MRKKRKKRPGSRRKRAVRDNTYRAFYTSLAGEGDMAIIRPAKPEITKAETKRIQEAEKAGEMTPEEASKAFDNIINKHETFTFVGVMTDRPDVVLDPNTKRPIPGAKVEPWDSFIPMAELAKFDVQRPS